MSRRQISRVRALPTLLIPAVFLLTLVSLAPDAHAQSKEDAEKGFKTIMLEGTSTTPELLIQIPEDELQQFDASELETQEEFELRVQAEHEHSDKDGAGKADFIRVTGRFGYNLPDGRFVPAPNVRVHPYRRTNGGGTWCLVPRPGVSIDGSDNYGSTDENGYFDVTFELGPCAFCFDTDIFVIFRMVGEYAQVGNWSGPSCGRDAARWVETGVYHDVEKNTTIDLGTHVPSSEEGGAWAHTLVNVGRTNQWLVDQGRYTGRSRVWWGDPETESRILDPSETACRQCWADYYLQIGRSHWYNDFEIAKLTATLWLLENHFPLVLDYCNGVCDGSGCSYCLWCPEDEFIALWDGVASWIAAEALDLEPASHVYYRPNIDDLSDCTVATQDPLTTPGIFAAILRDMTDADFDNHPEFPGVRDQAYWAAWEVLQIIADDKPTTPWFFFQDYRTRYPSRCRDLWETAANSGYNIDFEGPGVVPGGVTSSSHVASVPSPNAVVDVAWSPPTDDCSGVGGYSVTVTPNFPLRPDATQDIGPVSAWRTPILTEGNWWVNVRAVDNGGVAGELYASFGPVVIDSPTPANLTPLALPGWVWPVMPLAAPIATPTSVLPPPVLVGNSAATWWNSGIRNVGFASTGVSTGTWVLADGRAFYNIFDPVDHASVVPVLPALNNHASINLGPIQVRGGRHTFGVLADFTGLLGEPDEFDNGWGRSWVWTPYQVPVGGSTFRLAPSPRVGGWEHDPAAFDFNCDGLRFTQDPDPVTEAGYWNALTLVPAFDTADYDARLHPASTGAQNGFSVSGMQGWSMRPAGCLDAVFVNYNQDTTADWDVGIVEYIFGPALSGYDARHVQSEVMPYGTTFAVNMPVNQPMLLYEFNLGAGDTGFNSFLVKTTNGESPIHVMWLNEDFVTGDMDDYTAAAVTDESGEAWLHANVVDPGFSCLVIYRDQKDGLMGQSIDLTIEFNVTPPDLLPFALAGWDRALVPRPAADVVDPATVAAPVSLIGGVNSTYLNLGSMNNSPMPLGDPVLNKIDVDGSPALDLSVPAGYLAYVAQLAINQGPITVPGGLHTLSARVDGPDDIAEISETNNDHGEQWAWSGQALGFGPAGPFLQPPDPQGGWEYLSATEVWLNVDGFRTPSLESNPSGGAWAGLAAMPGLLGDVSLRAHLPSDDPQNAFRVPLAASNWSGSEVDFVLFELNTLGSGAIDAGVAHVSGTAGFELELVGSSNLAVGGGAKMPHTLAPSELLDLYEVSLTADVHRIRLENLAGGADLGMAVYAPGTGAVARIDNLTTGAGWFGGPGEDEIIIVDVPATDTYCLAVFKVRSDDAGLDAQYALDFLVTTDGPAAVRPVATAIGKIYPNPFNPRTTVSFDVAQQGYVELSIINVRGELVRRLVRSQLAPGTHNAVWDGIDDRGRRVASGVYVAQLNAAGIEDRKKMVLIK